MKFRTVSSDEMFKIAKSTTVGYWAFEKPQNKGLLTIYIAKLSDWRFWLAVAGHECLEVLYCWIMGITTEECDAYDQWAEEQYEKGLAPYSEEMAFRKGCPYRWGHIAGTAWEYFIIYTTLASWGKYNNECNEVMGIGDKL